jgi:hypothetical protein
LASLVAWWDFGDATTLFTDAGTTPVASDADAIYQANDKVGTAHLVQATLGARPLYKTGIQNGKSICRFDGSDDGIAVLGARSQPLHYITVFKMGAGNAENDVIYDSYVASDGCELRCAATATRADIYSGSFLTSNTIDLPAAAFQIWAVAFNGASSTLYVNGGAASASGNVGAGDITGIIFGQRSDTTRVCALDLAEHLICSAILSTADLNLLGAYLAAKWGLTWTDIT